MASTTAGLLDDVKKEEPPGDIIIAGNFALTPGQLSSLVDPKDLSALQKLGGVSGICQVLGVDQMTGLKAGQDEALRLFYGANILPHPDPPSFLLFLWDAYQDKTLLFLSGAALISLGIGIYTDIKDGTLSHWIEGAAIMVAVVLVVLVNAVNDYQKDRQFRALSARNEDRQVRVVRAGTKVQVSIYDVCVGDVILLDPGVDIPSFSLPLYLCRLGCFTG